MFLGCSADDDDGENELGSNYTGDFGADKIGHKIDKIIDNPIIGFNLDSIPHNINPIGECGGRETFWWCPKCEVAQLWSDK